MTLTADTVVAGAGVIGLCAATAIAARGRNVTLLSESRRGEASHAAAGMLAPSVERSQGAAHDFAIAARDFYPDYLEGLADSTGIRVPLNRLGVLQVALTSNGVKGLRGAAGVESVWLDRDELSEMEPTLGHALGAVMNPEDGAVDNVILMKALAELAQMMERITVVDAVVTDVSSNEGSVQIGTRTGEKIECADLVLAPGAWGASIAGAIGLAAVTPSRGQLVSYGAIGLRHVTYGPRGYLVPRASGVTIAGSTMENVGFAPDITTEGISRVKSAAQEIAPVLAVMETTSEWAGLRPVTPDMQPILGRDPHRPRIIYACGHSRNGILLAPLTGETVAALAMGEDLRYDLTPFRSDRFTSA